MGKIERKSNFELLRIISMVLIITHHYSVHGGFQFTNEVTSNQIIVQMLAMGGKLGVNLFVLISGYFMVKSNFSLKKIILIIMQVQFYSVIFLVIYYLFGEHQIGIKDIIKSIFPIIYSRYWFASNYIILYIFSPYINKLVENLNKLSFTRLLATIGIMWVIIPTFTKSEFELSNSLWFISLYLIGAYIRIYPCIFFDSKKKNFMISLGMFGLILFSVVVFNLLGVYISFFKSNAMYFMTQNKLPLVITSITFFLAFKNVNLGSNKVINYIASSMFGVYLIHDNVFIRDFLWIKLFKNANWLDSKLLILHALFTIFVVFLSCVFVDKLRMILEKYTLMFIEPLIIKRIIKVVKSINN